MRITVVGAVLIVAGVIVVFWVLNALNDKNGGAPGTQPPQGPEPYPGSPGV